MRAENTFLVRVLMHPRLTAVGHGLVEWLEAIEGVGLVRSAVSEMFV